MTAYINGCVFTVDDANPEAEAFIVDDGGIFVAVGSNEEIKHQADNSRHIVYSLDGSFVMPGIHDAHAHMLLSSLALTSHFKLPMHDLNNANIANHVKEQSCMCRYAQAHQDWLVGACYDVEDFHRSSLDADYPDTPIVLRGGAGHAAFLNTAALAKSGYDIQDEKDHQGARLFRDDQGHLTGRLAENGLSKALLSMPKPSAAHVRRCLKTAQAKLHAAGVTSCQEAATNTIALQAFQHLESTHDLKLELFPHIVYTPDWIGEEDSTTLHALIDHAADYKSTHIDPRFVKIILDGVPLPPYNSHAPLDPTTNTVNPTNLLLPNAPSNLKTIIQTYDSRAMTLKIHCTGQGATRLVLDAIASVRALNPNGPRHEIAHCSGVHEQDYRRFRELNVTAEMSPAFFFDHPVTKASGGLMDWDFETMVGERAHVTIGSDWGAGEEPDLLPCLQGLVGRVGGGEVVCRMLTLNGAVAVGRERDLGSIAVGKKANFIAVDRNLARGEFEGAKVLTTWFEGEIVFERV